MRTLKISSLLFLFSICLNQAIAQSTNFVGNWETTAPVSQYNGQIVRLQFASTSDPNVFVIVNVDTPKRKYDGKLDVNEDKIYTIIKKKNLYFAYIESTDMLECYNAANGVKIADLTRF